jgi:transcription initiation factor TFIIIB Brf1 subunit/transcription initiation factor TFIIB
MVRARTKLDDSELDAQLELLTKSMEQHQLACAENTEQASCSHHEFKNAEAAEQQIHFTTLRHHQPPLVHPTIPQLPPKDTPHTTAAELSACSYSAFMDMCVSGNVVDVHTKARSHRNQQRTQMDTHGSITGYASAAPQIEPASCNDHASSSTSVGGSGDGDGDGGGGGCDGDARPTYADSVCKECKVGVYQADAGFMVCPKCGDMDEACIETGAEWRSFGGADAKLVDPSRCGSTTSNYLMPPNMYSAGTQISSRWRKETEKMHLAQLLQRRLSANPRSRPLRNTLNEFRRATYNSGYSHKIVDEALHLYTSAKHVKNFRADNRVGLLAKCLSESCKKHGVSRSAKEICKDMGIAVDVMTKGHRALTKVRKVAEASNHKINEGSKRTRKTVDQPSDFVDRFCCRLKIPNDITEEIRQVTIAAKQMRLVSDNAPLVASACILLVTQHHKMAITGTDIQKVVSISHVTIDKCFKKLRDFKDALVG